VRPVLSRPPFACERPIDLHERAGDVVLDRRYADAEPFADLFVTKPVDAMKQEGGPRLLRYGMSISAATTCCKRLQPSL
jgi:hypothetical protein